MTNVIQVRKKVQQYFEKDPSIYIEKVGKEYKGTVAEWQTKYFDLLTKWQINEVEVKKLREENDRLKKERDLYKNGETNLGNKLAKFVGSATKESAIRSDTITRLNEELNKTRQYDRNIRKETDTLEKECLKSKGGLKGWNNNQIRKWLKDIYSQFNKVYLPETYGIINEGFYSWIKLLEAIADPESTTNTTSALKKVSGLILSQNELNRFLFSQKVADLTELSANIQNIIDEKDKNWNSLIQGQNKNKQLEIQITNKDNTISQKDKEIQRLQVKNEKLTKSYKKLIQHLADARLLVSHLQKDLSLEKQDKAHIQKELDDALAILNKPKTDVGVQTDLTAEQITQMENELKKLKEVDLPKINQEKQQKEQELQQQIQNLEQKVKDTDLNDEEKEAKRFLNVWIVSGENEWKNNWKSKVNKTFPHLGNLQPLCAIIDGYYLKFNQSKNTSQQLTQLQTKYDMEVRSKEELAEVLKLARFYSGRQMCLWIQKRDKDLETQKKDIKKLIKSGFRPSEFLVFTDNSNDLDFTFLNDYIHKPYSISLYYLNYSGKWEKRKIKVITQYPNIDKLEGEDYVAVSERKFDKHRFHFNIFDSNPIKVKEIGRELIKEYENSKDYVVEYEYWR